MEGTYHPVRVRVNDELVLDAGCCVEDRGSNGAVHIIEPPRTTLFHQVLAYLNEKPDPVKLPSGSMVSREGVATAAVTLRWGSYLAVLLDRDKPLWSEVRSPDTSRMGDGEMARINIEASAALAEWIDIYRAERGGRRYEQLVNRAVAYLPMPKKRTKLLVTEFLAFAQPELAAEFVELADPVRRARARQDVEQHASRVFANALLNTAWRNGPVEGIHAGHFRGNPMDHRRMTPVEERELMAFACERLALGMTVCLRFTMERSGRPWREQVLPYALADLFLITPSCWTLTESSREVRLSALDLASAKGEVP
jgi:hypothetical protein